MGESARLNCPSSEQETDILSYLIVPSFLTSDDVKELLARSRQLLEEFSLDDHPLVRAF
jgi:hypothetical protein